MQTLTISQEHYTDLQMSIAKLLKQVDDLQKQLANSLEINSRLASNLQEQRDINAKLNNERIVLRLKLEQLEKLEKHGKYSKLAIRNLYAMEIIDKANDNFRKEMKAFHEGLTDEDIDELQEIVNNLPYAIIRAVLTDYKHYFK